MPPVLRLAMLHDRIAALAGADANRILDRQHEDLAVANTARLGRPDDGLDHARALASETTTSSFTLRCNEILARDPRYVSV
jgi:hypothetical protein